ncbi:MAG: hypothetical protein J6S29_01080 [Methanosphaera sp.]|nr:hypothetical protein [Methanosphaera sp.]
MNTKLILAIAIVALVGVVAATYQINNTNDLTNSYTDVEPELQVEAGASDSADSVIGADSANSAPSNKNKDSTKKSSYKSSSKQNNKVSSTRSGSSSSSGSSSGSSTSSSGGPGQNAGSQATIDAYSVARSAGIQMGATSTRFISSFTVDGVVYNVYGQYKNGQLIGETEVNTKTGQITGGAYIGEVTHDTDSSGNNGGNNAPSSANSGSSSQDSSSNTPVTTEDTNNNETGE